MAVVYAPWPSCSPSCVYDWLLGWPCFLWGGCRGGLLCHCVPHSLFSLCWGSVLFPYSCILIWITPLIMLRQLLNGIHIFRCNVVSCRYLRDPYFYLLSCSHFPSNEWDLLVVMPIPHFHFNLLFLDAKLNL
jgi:hypothetical protein